MNFLPDPQRQGDIKFVFAKSLPYIFRMKLVAAFMVAGLLFQWLVNFWAGLVLLAAGTVLSLIKGYADKAVLVGSEEWAQVTPDEYKKVKAKQKELKRWDLDFFDITNPLGKAVFAGVGIFCFIVWYLLDINAGKKPAVYWKWDAVVILAPHWFSGIRSFLTKDRLIIKIGLLEKIMNTLASPSDIQVLPMLSTRETKDGGRVPMDARLMVRFLGAPGYFLGMQIQISINSVQGKDYPYLYCVLLAKEQEELFKGSRRSLTYDISRLALEETNSAGVDVLVVRQRTTKNSGYYTNLRASEFVVKSALYMGRALINKGNI